MSKGRFGIFGGQYISETLMNELIRLEECYEFYKKDPDFLEELDRLQKDGLDVPLDALTVEECAGAIAAALRAN